MNLLQTNPFETARKQKRPLIIDGALGSLLQQAGYKSAVSSWMTMVNETYPDAVIKIHKNYIKMGADIITTNTFRTNPFALEREGITNFARYVNDAVNISKRAIVNTSILIAGSNAPAEDCYQKERTISLINLQVNHHNHIDLLVNSGIYFILNETFSHLDEIKIVCKYCSNNKIPYVISLYFTEELLLLSGEPL
ncbi:MAG: homocysteine S-methyltransferase family protein, partial [Ignavibacteria bacterium]|nr:homocysteine S-methyltransferase family protein [Ignavibacteria bacterium]